MKKFHHLDTIISPNITEKSTSLSEFNKIVFKVHKGSSKSSIKKSIEIRQPNGPWRVRSCSTGLGLLFYCNNSAREAAPRGPASQSVRLIWQSIGGGGPWDPFFWLFFGLRFFFDFRCPLGCPLGLFLGICFLFRFSTSLLSPKCLNLGAKMEPKCS